MRYISEERLYDLLEDWRRAYKENDPNIPFINGVVYMLETLFNEAKELDELTVTKLRPMSEAPRDGELILVCLAINNEMIQSFYYIRGNSWSCDTGFYKDNELKGWIPMPQYKPEE